MEPELPPLQLQTLYIPQPHTHMVPIHVDSSSAFSSSPNHYSSSSAGANNGHIVDDGTFSPAFLDHEDAETAAHAQ
jgi:hypothetical protein